VNTRAEKFAMFVTLSNVIKFELNSASSIQWTAQIIPRKLATNLIFHVGLGIIIHASDGRIIVARLKKTPVYIITLDRWFKP
jgi:hypothetical protein